MADETAVSALERWKRFATVANLQIPDMNLEGIAPALERMAAATRDALRGDLGFTEPVLWFRFPGGER